MPNAPSLYSSLPSTDVLLKGLTAMPGVAVATTAGEVPLAYIMEGKTFSRAQVKEAVALFLDDCRASIRAGSIRHPDDLAPEVLLPRLPGYIQKTARPRFRQVLNGTGIVLHTNLGRSLLADEAVQAVVAACSRYSNLEMDLTTGQRGSRYSHVEKLICSLTGAEAALVVNNNAAAVFLMLDTLCKGREVVVSRGQLVEIGGSFRIPEVMEKSGCILKEVGATNRTHLRDYASAITENTAALLRVHTSNYRIVGFHSDVAVADMVALGRERNLPVLEDLGSGYLCELAGSTLQAFAQNEPPVRSVVAAGIDVVTFSGDKVLGGPQAGIIAGRATYIERIKRNPLNRALRIDKMTLAALEATLRLYTQPELALERVPTLRMICTPVAVLQKRARRLAKILTKVFANQGEASLAPAYPESPKISLMAGESLVGGGSFPERPLPTMLVAFSVPGQTTDDLRQRLLSVDPPLVVRVQDGSICIDMRTVQDDELSLVANALRQAMNGD